MKQDVFRKIANMEERANLKVGDTLNKPYIGDFAVQTYTKGTAMTAQTYSSTNEALSVDQVKAGFFYVDTIDQIQNIYSAIDEWTKEAAIRLGNNIDGAFLYEAINANDTIDDGDLGGTPGNGLVLATSNIVNFLGKINKKLDVQNVSRADRIGVISPQQFDVLWQYIAGKDTLLGDRTGENGQLGHFAGFELYMSNNLTGEATWLPANDPSNTQTITINGITFTFVSTIGTTAGNILISGTVAGTIDNLVALINAGGVTSDSGVSNVSLSAANQKTVSNWVAVDNTTSITVRAKGAGYMTVATSDAADVWTTTKQYQHSLFGDRRAIDLVIQKEPGVQMGPAIAAGLLGTYVAPYCLYGSKLFNKNTYKILDCIVRSDAY